MVNEPNATVTEVGTRGGVPMVNVVLSISVPVLTMAVAVIVTVASTAVVWLEVNVTVACPAPFVVAEGEENDPADATGGLVLLTAKLTVTPDTGLPEAFVTRAVIEVVSPKLLMAEGVAVTIRLVGPEGVPPGPPMLTVEAVSAGEQPMNRTPRSAALRSSSAKIVFLRNFMKHLRP
jgi:hypothetical protein